MTGRRNPEFASALEVFGQAGLPPAKALEGIIVRSDAEEGGAAPRYRLVSLRLAAGKIIEALLEPRPDPGAQVTLRLEEGAKRAAVRLTPQPRAFAGHVPPEFALGSTVAYGLAEILCDGLAERTEPRWIDNDVALDRSSAVHTLDDALKDLARNGSFNADRQRILETIRKVSAQLLSGADPPAPAAPRAHTSNTAPADNAQNATTREPRDPAAMVRSLQDITRERQQRAGATSSSYIGTLHGVMALLFAREDEPDDIDLGREAWGASEPDKSPPTPRSGQSSGEPSAAETLAAFKQQLRSFLAELAKTPFAKTCVSSRMVEALAYPLFLCLSAADAGWFPPSELSAVATRVTEIMLHQPYGPGKPSGLLHMVRQRHEATGRLDEFNDVIGSGTLWTVLLAALTPDPDASPAILLPQAAALSDVLQCQDLLRALRSFPPLQPRSIGAREERGEPYRRTGSPDCRRHVLTHRHPVRTLGQAVPRQPPAARAYPSLELRLRLGSHASESRPDLPLRGHSLRVGARFRSGGSPDLRTRHRRLPLTRDHARHLFIDQIAYPVEGRDHNVVNPVDCRPPAPLHSVCSRVVARSPGNVLDADDMAAVKTPKPWSAPGTGTRMGRDPPPSGARARGPLQARSVGPGRGRQSAERQALQNVLPD